MYPDRLFKGGPNLYGVSIAVGILCCFGVFFLYSKKKNFDSGFIDFVFYNAIVAIAVGFFTAQVMHTFYIFLATGEWDYPTGFSFLGGLLGGVISFLVGYFIFRKRLKQSIVDLLPLASICIVIAHAFGRLGCLFAGCCHGAYLGQEPTVGGIYMHGKVDGYYTWGYFVPTQLYESLFLFLLFAIFSLTYMKYNDKYAMSHYLISYGVFRFIIEFVRKDNEGKFLGSLTPSQSWCIFMVVLGVALYFFVYYFYKKKQQKTAQTTNKETPCDTTSSNV